MQPKIILAVAAFAATVPAANWLISNVGTQFDQMGPHLIPVGFGLMAPSGVLMIGAALVLRDLVHEIGGWQAALAAIVLGSILSWFVAPSALVIASVAAFALAELSDMAVYTPLRRRQLWLAVLASGAVGAVVDSAIFLWLAFGSLAFIDGQIVGKLWMTLLTLPLIYVLRALASEAK